jgi:hypothetical protein
MYKYKQRKAHKNIKIKVTVTDILRDVFAPFETQQHVIQK